MGKNYIGFSKTQIASAIYIFNHATRVSLTRDHHQAPVTIHKQKKLENKLLNIITEMSILHAHKTEI
jgi:hypothetical protein